MKINKALLSILGLFISAGLVLIFIPRPGTDIWIKPELDGFCGLDRQDAERRLAAWSFANDDSEFTWNGAAVRCDELETTTRTEVIWIQIDRVKLKNPIPREKFINLTHTPIAEADFDGKKRTVRDVADGDELFREIPVQFLGVHDRDEFAAYNGTAVEIVGNPPKTVWNLYAHTLINGHIARVVYYGPTENFTTLKLATKSVVQQSLEF